MLLLKTILLVFCLFVSFVVFSSQLTEGTLTADIQTLADGENDNHQLSRLKKRMAAYKISAVSIAFMENYRISWTLSEGTLDIVSPQKVDENTVFRTSIISKSEYEMILSTFRPESLGAPDNDTDTLLKFRQIPQHKSSQSREVISYSLINPADNTAPYTVRPYLAELLPTVINVFEDTHLAKTQIVPKIASMENNLGFQKNSELSSKKVPTTHQFVGSALEVSADNYAMHASEDLWITPSDLLKLGSMVQSAKQKQDKTPATNETRPSTLTPQLGSVGFQTYMETTEGTVISLSDNELNDGFSAHIFIHSHTGDGIAIMTNSDNGSELVNNLMPSVNTFYGWTELIEIEISPASLEPLPQLLITDDSKIEVPLPSAVVLVAEGEQN